MYQNSRADNLKGLCGLTITIVGILAVIVVCYVMYIGYTNWAEAQAILRQQVNTTNGDVQSLLQDADSMIDSDGRFLPMDTKRLDAWGRPIKITYTQGALSEIVEVRSSGPDGIPFNSDDVYDRRRSASLNGIVDNVGHAARSIARNSAAGIREGWREGAETRPADKPSLWERVKSVKN